MNLLRLTFTVLLFLSFNSFAEDSNIKTIDTGDGDVEYWVLEK